MGIYLFPYQIRGISENKNAIGSRVAACMEFLHLPGFT